MRITEWMNAARHCTLTLVHHRAGRWVEIWHQRGVGWTIARDGGQWRRADQLAVEHLLDQLAMHGYRRAAA